MCSCAALSPQASPDSPSPLHSLRTASRSFSEARLGREEERLLLKSVSPRETFGGPCRISQVHGNHAHEQRQEHISLLAAPQQAVFAYNAKDRLPRQRPRSAHRIDSRRHGQNEPGLPTFRPHSAPRKRLCTDEAHATTLPSKNDVELPQGAKEQERQQPPSARGPPPPPRERPAADGQALSHTRRGYYAHLGTSTAGTPLHPSGKGICDKFCKLAQLLCILNSSNTMSRTNRDYTTRVSSGITTRRICSIGIPGDISTFGR